MIDKNLVLSKFPPSLPASSELLADKRNPAIRLYGRRFYKDQTSIEYLAEFLLAFSSPKRKDKQGECGFTLLFDDNALEPCYYPEEHIALKLFTFFPSSKLETRHPVHRDAYIKSVNKLEKLILAYDQTATSEAINLLQSLLTGFTGVASNRTWVTSCFLPASYSLLSREVSWESVKAKRAKQGDVIDWESSEPYFSNALRNFMSRGGELLFLQLANLFNDFKLGKQLEILESPYYKHLAPLTNALQSNIEKNLRYLIKESLIQLEQLTELIESTLDDYKLNNTKRATFGWVPRSSRTEGFLFACEIQNICSANYGVLDKLELLQILCSMQILRSLCFQARRIDESLGTTQGFCGEYVWIVANPEEAPHGVTRKLAQASFTEIEAMLFRALRNPILKSDDQDFSDTELSNGDDNCFRHFNKFSKELGLVIPRTGASPRFTLNQALLRFLVAALIAPGERIRLNHFYQRIFAHYGIAIGHEQLSIALKWIGKETESDHYSSSSKNTWVEEALKQGGFLVELSDAVSMVENPSAA